MTDETKPRFTIQEDFLIDASGRFCRIPMVTQDLADALNANPARAEGGFVWEPGRPPAPKAAQ